MNLRRIFITLLFLLSGCSGTRIAFQGDRLLSRLRGELRRGRVLADVRLDVDSTPALIVVPGFETALELLDDVDAPNSRLYLVIDAADLKAGARLKDGAFVPYLEVRAPIDDATGDAHAFVALCRGGRGEVRIDVATREVISGHLEITVSCRTFVDGYEREESTLALNGPFSAAR